MLKGLVRQDEKSIEFQHSENITKSGLRLHWKPLSLRQAPPAMPHPPPRESRNKKPARDTPGRAGTRPYWIKPITVSARLHKLRFFFVRLIGVNVTVHHDNVWRTLGCTLRAYVHVQCVCARVFYVHTY